MAWDLVPVTIYVENRSAEFNFEVRVQDIKLTLADGTKFERVSAVEVAEIASWSGAWSTGWWLFLIFPGAISLANISGANAEMEEDYIQKTLKDRNLPKATSNLSPSLAKGVLFFRPKGKSLSDCDLTEGTLFLEITKRGESGGETIFGEMHPERASR
jgi:hypothetical protein